MAIFALSAAADVRIHDVSLSRTQLDTARGDGTSFKFSLSTPATVSIKLIDPDLFVIRSFPPSQRKAGPHTITWNGKDDAGLLVPNESYFFTIEAKDAAGNVAVYDPITFSGGEFADITQGQVNRQSGTLSYQLSQPSRVLLRAGIRGSALYKTIVDWEPRPAGAVTEYWNGRDEDNLIDLADRKHTIVLSYMTLPATSVIAFGNTRYSYRQYRSARMGAARKPQRPMVNNRQISPHFLKSRLTDRAFRVRLTFPEIERGTAQTLPAVKDRVILRIDVDPADMEILRDQQFEVIIFVDTVFHTEEERGYVPFNSPVELQQLPPGEHLITANIITLGDQIGVGSRKVRVVK